jgi:alcohol dehydrogenase
LVKVDYIGICGTDKAIYKGTYRPKKMPIILGHEFTGIITDISDDLEKDLMGRRIVSEINITCGSCWFCTNGLKNHCIRRETLGISRDGALAEYIVLPAENIYTVDLDPLDAVFVEPLASILEMINITPPKHGSNIAVIGSGTIASLALQVLRYYYPNQLVTVVRGDSPKKKFIERYSDTVVSIDDVDRYTMENTIEGRGFDYVVEASGSIDGFSIASKIVRPRGTIAVKSTHGSDVTIDLTRIVVDEVVISGSRCGPFIPAIKMIEDKTINVRDLISNIYPLDQVDHAFERSLDRSSIKIIVSIP